ncbi:MAG: hypothetical protein U0T69_05475, partial [Chitinophagales bacterium]
LMLDKIQSINGSRDTTDFFVIKIDESNLADASLKTFISNNKVFIEVDFNKENILSFTEILKPYGIQITCKKEEKTGFSFVDEYAELLDSIGF